MTEAPQLPSTSTNRPLAPATAAIAFLAPPPLIEGEDAASYDDLLTRISGTLKPADILEEIWVRDVVDLVWDAFRLRRLKAHLLTAAAHEGVAKLSGRCSTGISPIRSRGDGRFAMRTPSRRSKPRLPQPG